MASKEHQGLHIGLIVSVLLIIALGVTTFAFYSEWSDQVAVAEAERKRSGEESRAARLAEEELTTIKLALGKTPDDKTADIEAEIQNLMKKYAATYPDPAQTVPAALENQLDAYLQLQAERGRYQDQIAQLENEKKSLQDELNSKVAAFDADKNEQLKQVLELTQKAEAERRQYQEAVAARDNEIRNKQGQIQTKEQDAEKEKTRLTNMLQDLKTNFDRQNVELTTLKDTDIESPDGLITGVSERQRLVWINVGAADGLRRQTTFSVYDRDVSQVTADTPTKAKIEVIRLLDSHVAEARILEDDVRNPILKNDKIFSTVFSPGQQEYFGLAGKIDIDGDGIDDLERMRSIISINGGVIDAVVDSKGKREGKVDYRTRFLIVGEPPQATEQNAQALANYAQLLKEAEAVGVKQISVSKFLDYVGYQVRERSVGLGRRADPDDFKPRTNGSSFRFRTP